MIFNSHTITRSHGVYIYDCCSCIIADKINRIEWSSDLFHHNANFFSFYLQITIYLFFVAWNNLRHNLYALIRGFACKKCSHHGCSQCFFDFFTKKSCELSRLSLLNFVFSLTLSVRLSSRKKKGLCYITVSAKYSLSSG